MQIKGERGRRDQEPAPDGPRLSTPIIFKNGSIILFFRSSNARFSLSFDGMRTRPEIKRLAKMPAKVFSTARRREAIGFVLVPLPFLDSDVLDEDDVDALVKERDWRRKLPPEVKAAEEAGVGPGREVVDWVSS